MYNFLIYQEVRRINSGKLAYLPMLTNKDLTNLIPSFIEHLVQSNSSKSTIKNYVSDLRTLIQKLPADTEIGQDSLGQALSSLSGQFSESTLRRFSYSLKAFTGWLSLKGYDLKSTTQIKQTIAKDISTPTLQQYSESIKAQGAAVSTTKLYTNSVASFLVWLRPNFKADQSLTQQNIDNVSRKDIERYISYLRYKGTSESTIINSLYSLKSFFNLNKADIVYETNPVRPEKVRATSVRGKLAGILPTAQIAGFFKFKKPRFWHAYRGHPLSDYVNWAATTGTILIVGLLVFEGLFAPKPLNITELTNTIQKGLVLAATPPRVLSFQGRLADENGIPVTTNKTIVFKIYDAETSGTLLWTSKNWSVTPDSNGVFSVCLGGQDTGDDCLLDGVADTAIGDAIFRDNASTYLDITVAGQTLTPRQRIASSPYALNSDNLDGIDSTAFLRSDTSDNFTSGTLTTDDGTTFTVNSTTIGLGNATGDTITINGTATFNTDTNITLAGTENVAMTSDLGGTVDVISIIGSPSASAGTTQGLFIQQAANGNSNGLDVGIKIDNADTDLLLTDAISITNTGAFGNGYTNFLNTPTIDITGAGTIAGATGLTSSGTITFSGFTNNNNSVVYAGGSGNLGVAETTSTGICLLSNGASAAPSWQTCPGGTTRLDQILAANTSDTDNDSLNNNISWNWSTLTTQRALTLNSTSTGLTTGGIFALGSSTTAYNHGAAETGSLATIALKDTTSGAFASTTNGLLVSPEIDITAGAAIKTINGLSVNPTFTACTTATACNVNGLNIANVTDSGNFSGSAIKIGTGWDRDIFFTDTTPIIEVANDSSARTLSITNPGAGTADLDVEGHGAFGSGASVDTNRTLNLIEDKNCSGAGGCTYYNGYIQGSHQTRTGFTDSGAYQFYGLYIDETLQGGDDSGVYNDSLSSLYAKASTGSNIALYGGLFAIDAELRDSSNGGMAGPYAAIRGRVTRDDTGLGSIFLAADGGVVTTGLYIADLTSTSLGINQVGSDDANYLFGPTSVGSGSVANARLDVGGSVSVASGQSGRITKIAGSLTEFSSGNHPLLAGLEITAPGIGGGAATVTNTASLYLSGAPNATVSGSQNVIMIDTFSAPNQTLNAINIGILTSPQAAVETAINIGTGWDTGLALSTPIGGEAIDITTVAGVRTTAAIDLNESNTSGTVPTIQWDSAETRGGLLDANLTGALGTENLVDITTTAAFTSNIFSVTTATAATSGNLIDLNFGNIADTGNAIDISMGASAVNAKGINISTAAGIRTDNAIAITENNTSGTVPSITWSSSETRGGFLSVTSNGALATENLIDINTAAAWTSNLIDITTGAQIWTGNMFDINVGAAAATGDVINIALGSSAPAVQALVVTGSTSTATGGVISLAVNTAADQSSDILDITSTLGIMNNSDIFQAIDINITGANHTGTLNEVTGVKLSLTTPDAEATETAVKIGANWDNSILFVTDWDHLIKVQDQDTGAANGSNLNITGAAGNTSGTGGAINITAGAAGSSGKGGSISLVAQSSSVFASSGHGGSVSLTTGTGSTVLGDTAGNGGDFNVTFGNGGPSFGGTAGRGGQINWTLGNGGNDTNNGTAGAGGFFSVRAGDGGGFGLSGGAAGYITLTAGNGTVGSVAGGAVNLVAGVGGPTGAGGAVAITSGAGGSTSGNSGAITLLTGNPVSGTAGNININVGTSTTSNGSILIGNAARAQTIIIGNETGATSLELDSGTGNISIGNAVAKIINIGNSTGATLVNIDSGTNGVTIDSTDAGDIRLNSSDTLLLDSAGILELNSSAGAISIGNDAVAQNINIGTGSAARTITVGNTTGATTLNLIAGTGSILLSGQATGTSATFLGLPVKTDSGDPTTTQINGAIYYNSNSSKFRCFQASSWTDCIGAGGSFSGEVDDTTNDSLTFTSDDASPPAGTVNSIFRDNTGDLNINTVTGKTLNVQIAGADEYNFSATGLALNGNNITSSGTITLDATSTVIIPDADTFQTDDVTSTGALTLTGGSTLTLNSTTSSTLTIDSTTTGQIDIGVNNNSKTINIGTGTAVNTINIGTGGAASAEILTIGSTDTDTSLVLNAGGTGSLINFPEFDVNTDGDILSAFTQLDGTDTTNGSGSGSSSLVLNDATGFNVGNYVRVDPTGSNICSGSVTVCYAKITAINSNTLTISPALTWDNGAAVDEFHIPEVGATDTASTLTNRYGRGYFIDGVLTGNASTLYTDQAIEFADAGTFKFVDPSGNNLFSILDNGTTGNVTITGTLNVTGAITGSASDLTCTNCIGPTEISDLTLGTDTAGDYVGTISTSVLTGLAGGAAGSEGTPITLALDYSQALSGDISLAAHAAVFGQSGLVFEGSGANAFETFFSVTNPTADNTFTFPDRGGTISLSGDTFTGDVTATLDTDGSTALTVANVAWSALSSYPSACGAGTAVTTLDDSPTCTAFTRAGTAESITGGWTFGTGATIFNSASTFNTDVDLTFSGGENLRIYNPTASDNNMIETYATTSVNALQLFTVYDSTDSNTYRALYSFANTNGITAGSPTISATVSTSSFNGNTTSGTATFIGLNGIASSTGNTGGGTYFTIGGRFSTTGATGTASTSYGIQVGASGSNNNYGILVDPITTAGSGSNYGIYLNAVSGASTSNYTIYINDTSGTASGGITWNGDTNLYRSGANTLKTDDTINLGAADYNTDANGVLYTTTAGVLTQVAETETGSQCLLSGAGASGVPTWGSCGGGSQTPWTSDIDADNFSLLDFGPNLTARTTITLASTGAGNDIIINGADIFDIQDNSVFSGTVGFNTDVDLTFAGTENFTLTSTSTGATSLLNIAPGASTDSYNGILVNLNNSSDAGADTISGLKITQTLTNDVNDTINGIEIGTATGGTMTERAISVSTGWDSALYSIAAPAAGVSGSIIELVPTLNAMNGSDTVRGMYLNLTNGNHTSTSNLLNGIEINLNSGDADATETGLKIGANWDIGIEVNSGIDFVESDTNPSCASGDYRIYADTSDGHLKKCDNGAVSDLDTETTKYLVNDHTLTSSQTTGTEVTELSMTLVAGTYTFYYQILAQTSTDLTGLAFGINYTGTATKLLAHERFLSTGTTASNAICDDVGGGVASEGIEAGDSTRTETTTAPDLNVMEDIAADNQNCLVTIEGIIEVSDGGDLELWHASETAANTTVDNGSSVTVQRITAGADLAEVYGTRDESVDSGDIVSLDSSLRAGVKKSSGRYDKNIFGIVSTKPGLTIGSIDDPNAYPVQVALSGRVPVKVSAENGPIRFGDLLTSSSIPGVAMRATKAGQIIGQAMSEYSGDGIGKVMAFVKTDYSNGSNLKDILESNSSPTVDENGNLQSIDLSGGNLGLTALNYFLGQTQINDLDISEIITDRLAASLEIITPTLTAQKIALTGNLSLTDKSNTETIRIDSDGNAYFSGTISADKIKANQIEGLEELLNGKGLLSNDNEDNLVATVSAGAKFVWNNTAGQAVAWVSDRGEAIFKTVTAALGEFTKLVFGEAVVKKDAKTAGEASFALDATEVFIESDKVNDESLINLTPVTKTGGLSLYVKEKRSGEGFVVALERNSGDLPDQATASATTAIKFTWFILNQE